MLERHATADSSWQRLSPAGPFRGHRKDRFGARTLIEESQPIRHWILLCGGRQLVHEALDDEDIVGGPDAAPEGCWNPWRLHPHIVDVHAWQGISEVDCAFGRVRVETILEKRWCPSGDDGGACEAMVPGDRHTLVIETGGHPVEPIRAVHVVLDVFLARPHDLDRALDMLCDLNRARDTVDVQSPSEAAADQMIVD